MYTKLDVIVRPDVDRETGEIVVLSKEVLEAKMEAAGWSEDPGTGRAFLTPGGSEVLSPMPVAPPVGYVHEESAMDRLERMLLARLAARLDGDMLLDESEAEANDFDVPDDEDFHPRSVYEIQMVEEVPALPRSREEPAAPVPVEVEPVSEGKDGSN